ncbi:HK97 gp10 family phage protein [Streptomyces sp. NPDC102364]|uniref:HK97 gp10 family phage protein n=1 Tax=Streptomyces sp. NPDC102364 TaxID=3366161 RepID=UPI00380FDC95
MSHLDIHTAEVRRLLYAQDGPVVRKVRADTRRVQAYAKQYAPVDDGPLRASITADVTVDEARGRVTGRVGSRLPYAIYQELGTGIYGPRGTPIRPKRGRFLVFTPKGASRPVFARQVRGSRPQRYLTRALAVMAAQSGYQIRPGTTR